VVPRNEPPSAPRQRLAQFAADDAGLNAHQLVADGENSAEMHRQIDDDPRPQRRADLPGAGAARHQRHLVFAGVAEERL
jgi:hypothetical protein